MPKKKAGQRQTQRPTRAATKGQPQRSSAPASTGTPRNSQSDSQNTPAVTKKEESRRARLDRACKRRNGNSGLDLDEYFRIIGLQIRRMTGDGNCMFRAFGDQVEGNENNHRHYRGIIVDHITKNKEQFDTFHEQEEEKNFDIRLKKLSKNGTFGGQECLVAFARAYNRLVFVHQPDEKIMLQLPPNHNVDPGKLKQVHLLYTGGNHYDSIRLINENNPRAGANVYLVSDENGIRCTHDRRNISTPVPEDQGVHDASQEFDDDKNTEDDDGPRKNVDLLKHERDSGLGSVEGSREPSISSRTEEEVDTVPESPEIPIGNAEIEILDDTAGLEKSLVPDECEDTRTEDDVVTVPSTPDTKRGGRGSPRSDAIETLSKREKRRQRRGRAVIPEPSPPSPVTELSSTLQTRMVLA